MGELSERVSTVKPLGEKVGQMGRHQTEQVGVGQLAGYLLQDLEIEPFLLSG